MDFSVFVFKFTTKDRSEIYEGIQQDGVMSGHEASVGGRCEGYQEYLTGFSPVSLDECCAAH